MQCPRCNSLYIRKNGKKQGKQNYICVGCGRQVIDAYSPAKGYSDDVKRECLEMYVNGLGFRAIERVKGVHHTTVINWVKQVGNSLSDVPERREIPEVAELDRHDLPLVVGMDGGYVRSYDKKLKQKGNFEIMAGKSIKADGTSKVFSAYCYDTKPQRRIFEVLKSQGMQMNQQVTFLSDGDEKLRELVFGLNPNTEYLLD